MKRLLFLLLATTLLVGSYAYGETLQYRGGTYIGEVVDGRPHGQGSSHGSVEKSTLANG